MVEITVAEINRQGTAVAWQHVFDAFGIFPVFEFVIVELENQLVAIFTSFHVVKAS